MRLIVSLGLAVLLVGCTAAPQSTAYYTQTVQSWRGASVKSLVDRWGTPDSLIKRADGTAVYIYKTESYHLENATVAPQIGVNFKPGGRPVIITTPNPDMAWNRGKTSLNCFALFEVNKQAKIVRTTTQGGYCYYNPSLVNPNRQTVSTTSLKMDGPRE